MAGDQDEELDGSAQLYTPSGDELDEEGGGLPPVPAEDLRLVEGQVYSSTGYDAQGDVQCRFTWVALRLSVGVETYARPRFLFSSDPYWDWWALNPGERGAVTARPLVHVCQTQPCQVQPPRGCSELVHITDATPVSADELRQVFASFLSDNPDAVWPADLFGPRLAGGVPAEAPARRPAASEQPGLDELWSGDVVEAEGSSRRASLRGKLEAAQDRFARLQQQRRAAAGAAEAVAALDDKPPAKVPRQGGPPPQRSLAEVLEDRVRKAAKVGAVASAEDAKGAEAAAAAAGQGGAGVQELLTALLKALQSASRSSDDPSFGGDGGVATAEGDLLPKGLASRRAHCRRLALEHPGRLAELSLAQMAEFLGSQDGGGSVDPHGPIVLRFLLSVYLPQHPVKEIGGEIYRELRTIAEALDLLLQGRTAAVADILAQRFKAIQVAVGDGSWSAAKWLELIPPRDQPLALRNEEEEMIRSIQHGELKLEELASRLRQKPQGSAEADRMLADRSAAPARSVVLTRPWKDAKAKYPKKPGETVKDPLTTSDFQDWLRVVTVGFGSSLTAVDLSVTLLGLAITDPGGLGAFAREFTMRTSTRRWIRSRCGPRSGRCRLAGVARSVMVECWLYMEVLGLNRMYCGRATATWQHEGSLTLAQRQAMTHLLSRAEVFAEDPFASVEVPALSSALQHAAIDYSGEPTVKALPCVLAELKPGLPQPEHAGALDACEFVDADIGAWLNDPTVALKPEAEWPNPLPRARVNVISDSDWEALAVHLVKLGIFTVLEPHEVFQVRGAPLLNGLFAVEKKGAPGPGAERVTRLILNMVPGNSLLKPFVGEASTLAASTGWTTLHLPEGSLLLWSGDDQKGAFFVWRIPRCWHAHMAVGKALRGDLFGRAAPRVFVASAVISMGWMLAVPLFQHIHRRLCRLPPPLGAGLPPEAEWRKDTVRPLAFAKQGPVLASWWQVYIDDFDAPEIIEEAAALELLGSQAELQAAARASYGRAQVAISSDKAHLRQLRVERMGASVDGVTGRIGAPLSKALSACGLAIATLGVDLVPWRLAMTVLGRLVRVFEFRRPLLSILNAVWRLSEPRAKVYLTREMREELMTALLVIPLAATSLRSRLEGMASCSDASEFGGGVCVSTGLHEQAEASILAAGEPGAQLGAGARVLGLPVDPRAPWTRSNPRIPRAIVARVLRVLCIGLFDGIGGLAVALSRLPVRIVGYVSAETDAKARRVVRLRWPGAIDWGDVRTVTAQTVEDLRIAYQSEVDLVVAGAGSPCQGLTVLNAAGRGLADPKSSVFFEVPRIFGLLSDAFGARFRWLVENVAGMTSSSLRGMSQALGVKPVFLCASALVPCRRPRLYWLSWSVRPTPPLVLQEREDMFVVSCSEPPLLNLDWQDPGARWIGEPGPYPTLVCSRPQRGYPSAPRGVKSASPEALARWQSDSYRYHVALYEEKNLLQDSDGSLRVPSSSERERMMGFDVRYTAVATKGSNQQDSDDARSFLLGNSFNVFSVAWLLQWLLLSLGAVTRPLSMQELGHVGECTPSWDETGCFESDAGEPETEASRLLLLSYLARSEKGGSDVRLDVNLPYRPKGWPRSSLDPFVWKWRVVLSIAWPKRRQAHINVRELQAALAALRWRARAARRHCSRWLHLVDSQVVAAIITKGRSSSARLQPMLRRWAAVAVAADMYPLIGYIVSENNPADEPSRKLWRGSRLRGRGSRAPLVRKAARAGRP
ncbi:unnamed protein product [Prorocentrum cordatum]|uniref:DNA (cytosine-5-)-methyltransferase n=1 Tax=Prorocentrum cordatum TaxID=2364126 RepID=A0ABN9TK70_9DINO|nr:unnamed protein product [Polarella glacialis]